jgi:hypothetical protein
MALTLTLALALALALTLALTLTKVERSWEESRAMGYVAQYTKELAANEATLRLLNQGRPPQHAEAEEGPAQKRQRV